MHRDVQKTSCYTISTTKAPFESERMGRMGICIDQSYTLHYCMQHALCTMQLKLPACHAQKTGSYN